MASTGMLEKAAALADEVRGAGGKVFHVPIMFKEDATDNPNKKLGILAGCADGKLFTEATWNTEFCKEMAPKEGDVVVKGKKGLDAFPHSDLEAQLAAAGIETVALCGFLTNCCVESTMRTACEKGFNVITVTDCCAATSEEGAQGRGRRHLRHVLVADDGGGAHAEAEGGGRRDAEAGGGDLSGSEAGWQMRRQVVS